MLPSPRMDALLGLRVFFSAFIFLQRSLCFLGLKLGMTPSVPMMLPNALGSREEGDQLPHLQM